MNPLEIAIIVIVCLAFGAAVTFTVIRKVKHKGCCDECSSCSSACVYRKPDEKKNESEDKSEMPAASVCDGHCEHCAQTHGETADK